MIKTGFHTYFSFPQENAIVSSTTPQQYIVSLASLNLPPWYINRPNTTSNINNSAKKKESGRAWRKMNRTQSFAVSTPITTATDSPTTITMTNCSGSTLYNMSTSRSNRWSCHGMDNCQHIKPSRLPNRFCIKSNNSFLSYKQPVIGWRVSWDSLRMGSSFLSPTQRLTVTRSLMNSPDILKIRV